MPDSRRTIHGIPIDFLTMDQALDQLVTAAAERRFRQVATVNLDFMVSGNLDPEVHSILQGTYLNLPDGAPVVWAGRATGTRHAERIAGADLVPMLVGEAARAGLRVFLLGGEDGSAQEAGRRFLARYPGSRVDHYQPPHAPLEEMDNATILARVDAAQPHLLLVAFGHPKQEKWIHRHQSYLPMLTMGVGCTLDVVAGRRARAPQWMQKAGLEWSYRLAREHKRLAGRYASDGRWLVGELVPWVASEWLVRSAR